jgi:hypothetical protein
MSAFLAAMELVLEVYARGTIFGKKLCKLDNG